MEDMEVVGATVTVTVGGTREGQSSAPTPEGADKRRSSPKYGTNT